MPKITKQTTKTQTKVVGKGVLSRISEVEDFDDGLKMLVYGRTGTGKTTFWSTFPGKILCMVCSGGNRKGELKSIPRDLRKKVDAVTLSSTMEIEEIVDHQKQTGEYATIVLDHLTGFQDMKLKEILGMDTIPEQKTWGMAKQQDYGQMALQCKEHLRKLIDLPVNIVLVSQERTFNVNEDGGDVLQPTVGSALTPSLSGWVYAACDYVVNVYVKQRTRVETTKVGKEVIETVIPVDGEVDYCMRIRPHPIYHVKFRLPKGTLPKQSYLVDPSYAQIAEIING